LRIIENLALILKIRIGVLLLLPSGDDCGRGHFDETEISKPGFLIRSSGDLHCCKFHVNWRITTGGEV
jgi:hypothetical protein